MATLLILIVVFLVLSGVLAAVDAAVLSVTRPEIEEMVVAGKWGARRLETLRNALTRAVVVIVILTNTVNVLGPVVVSRQATAVFGPQALAVTVAGLTVGTIIFSEILPKALGAHHAPLVSRLAAPGIRAMSVALYPVVRVLEWLTHILKRGRREIGTEEQIRALVTMGRRAGLIEGDEMRMIQRAFVLNDRTAADLMTPAERVAALPAATTVREAAARLRSFPYSRFPVTGESIDDIRGLVLSRDILEALADHRDEAPVGSLVRPALMVEAGRRSDGLLATFRDEHLHLAVVRDDGRTLGVVTLEDVLEELVGEIEDEKDVEVTPARIEGGAGGRRDA